MLSMGTMQFFQIIIKLAKVKGEYGSYDSWTDLTSKKTKEAARAISKEAAHG